MIWIILYLISVIVLATILCCAMTGDHVSLDSSKNILTFAGCMLAYPLVIAAIPLIMMKDHCDRLHNKEINRIRELTEAVKGENARIEIVKIDEQVLKSLLKNVRKGEIELSANQIDIVRQELLTRNMERNLTK